MQKLTTKKAAVLGAMTVCLLAFAGAANAIVLPQPASRRPLTYEGQIFDSVSVTGDVSRRSVRNAKKWDYWCFEGNEGDEVSITLDRTSSSMDPTVALYEGLGTTYSGLSYSRRRSTSELTWLAGDDDSGSDSPAGPYRNSLIADFTLPTNGAYTIAVMDSCGSRCGPWSYELALAGSGGALGGGGTEVPEPATLGMLVVGAVALGVVQRRIRNKKK